MSDATVAGLGLAAMRLRRKKGRGSSAARAGTWVGCDAASSGKKAATRVRRGLGLGLAAMRLRQKKRPRLGIL